MITVVPQKRQDVIRQNISVHIVVTFGSGTGAEVSDLELQGCLVIGVVGRTGFPVSLLSRP